MRRKLDTPFSGIGAVGERSATPPPDGEAAEACAGSVALLHGDDPPSARTQALLDPILIEMGQALDDGHHARALRAAEDALRLRPSLAVALMCKRECTIKLEATYLAQIGPLTQILVVLDRDAVTHLDMRARFLVSNVDGVATIAEVARRSFMDRLSALRILAELFARGILGPA